MKVRQNIRVNGCLSGFVKSSEDRVVVETSPFRASNNSTSGLTTRNLDVFEWPCGAVRVLDVVLRGTTNTLPFDIKITLFGQSLIVGEGERITHAVLVAPPTKVWAIDLQALEQKLVDVACVARYVHSGTSKISVEDIFAFNTTEFATACAEGGVGMGDDQYRVQVINANSPHIDVAYRVACYIYNKEEDGAVKNDAITTRTSRAWYVPKHVLTRVLTFMENIKNSLKTMDIPDIKLRVQRADGHPLGHNVSNTNYDGTMFVLQLNLELSYFSLL